MRVRHRRAPTASSRTSTVAPSDAHESRRGAKSFEAVAQAIAASAAHRELADLSYCTATAGPRRCASAAWQRLRAEPSPPLPRELRAVRRVQVADAQPLHPARPVGLRWALLPPLPAPPRAGRRLFALRLPRPRPLVRRPARPASERRAARRGRIPRARRLCAAAARAPDLCDGRLERRDGGAAADDRQGSRAGPTSPFP